MSEPPCASEIQYRPPLEGISAIWCKRHHKYEGVESLQDKEKHDGR